MKRLRRLPTALAVTLLMSACAAPQQQLPDKAASASATLLVPQPEGTPLPPRDPRVADHWPPEFKQMIDNLLSLYPRDGKPPSVKEVEKKMGITLTERPLTSGEFDLYKRYTVSGTSDMEPSLWGGGAARYTISRADERGRMTQRLTLVTSRSQTGGFCLDPYELAVYTGSKFAGFDSSPHATPRFWPAAYVWGMFERNPAGHYVGESFSVELSQRRDRETRKIVGAGCVGAVSVAGRYFKE
jgi:hypothetical protein